MDIYNMKAHEIKDKLQKKEISAAQVVKAYIDRIEKVDGKVGAYLEKDFDNAVDKAAVIDKKISLGEDLQGLAGIPCAIKDNISTKNVKTTCASLMLENYVPPYDATVVERLNNSGAIMLGKANMDEFAMGSSNENSAFKKVRNPWDLDRVPGGSSGGSAASVAAGEAAFSLGSDTGGSIRQPASYCNLVGIKPTYGRVSRYGLIAFASSLDQIGAFTKDVEDMALVLNSIAGRDYKDSTSYNIKTPDYTKSLSEDIRGMKIGIPMQYFGEGIDDDVKKSVLDSIELLKSMGAEAIEVDMPYTEYALAVYYILSSAEASSNLARYDGIRYGYRSKNYDDSIDLYIKSRSEGFGDEVKRRIMLGTYTLSSGYYDAYYNKALKVRSLVKKDFENAFKKCDCLVSPVSPTTPFKIGEKIDDPMSMYMLDVCTVPINIAGVCAMSIPCGFSNGLPIGLQLIGNYFEEEKLLKVGYAYQKNTNWHNLNPKVGE